MSSDKHDIKPGVLGSGGGASSETASTEAIVHGIERTRADMSATLSAIEQRLSPHELGAKAEESLHVVEQKVKEAVREQFEEAKAKVKEELVEAKYTLKHEVQEAVQNAKQALRDATIGKVETMARRANETAIETRDSVFETIRENPIPAALTGIGLAWLLMSRKSSNRYEQGRYPYYDGYEAYGSGGRGARGNNGGIGDTMHRAQQSAGRMVGQVQARVGDIAHQASDTAGHAYQQAAGAIHHAGDAANRLAHDTTDAAGRVVNQAGEVVSQYAHQATDAAGNLVHQASESWDHLSEEARQKAHYMAERARWQAQRMEASVQHTFHENPVALGAVALAAGAAIGLWLPRTSRENEWMGETRDHLFDRAQEAAQGATHGAFETAHHLTESVAEKAKGALEQIAKLRSPMGMRRAAFVTDDVARLARFIG